MMNNLVILPIFVPFICAVLCLIFRSTNAQRFLSLSGGVGATLAAGLLLQIVHQENHLVLHLGGWSAPFGIVLVADLFSSIMVLISSIMGILVTVYSLRDIDERRKKLYYFPLFNFLIMGVNGAFLTGDIFNLYVWFEVMLIASFVLLALGGERRQLEGAFKYVAINLVSSALFLAGAGLLYAKVGTLNMADIALKLSDQPDSILINSTATLFLIAFGVKAALFPFFFWLPASYHTPPTAVSAIFAGLLTKVGVYALIRSFTLFFNENFAVAQDLLLGLAALTMITGVLGAAAKYDIRKILSFHIVSQIGYMIMGLALHTSLALAATVFYIIHHIIVKTNLFLIGGIVEKLKGTGDLSKLGGLYKALPWLAVLFFIPAFSLGGIPPLSGFWAKFGLIKASLEIETYWIAGIALVVGIMTLFSMTKIWVEAFWKKEPQALLNHKTQKNLKLLYAPAIIMAAMTIYLGLFGQSVFGLAERTAEQLLNPSLYIEAVLEIEL